MHGHKSRMVSCTFHPYKKCEHFCQDHIMLICNICLRKKHRSCRIVDESLMKFSYEEKIREANEALNVQINETIPKTQSMSAVLDIGINRLKKYNRDIDDVIVRLHEMKDNVEAQRKDIRKTMSAISDIDRSLKTATEHKQCKKCYEDIDIERIKFERKQQKVLKTPKRLNENIKIAFGRLSKEVKSMRNDVQSQFIESKKMMDIKSHVCVSTYREPVPNAPYMMIRKKYALVRAPRLRRIATIGKRGDDGRESLTPFVQHIKLPWLTDVNGSRCKSNQVVTFSMEDSKWHIT